MNLQIDKQSSEPVYEQIRRQVEQLVRDGLLPAGTRIPSVRQLALSLGVSKNTVSMAYEELAAQSIIETRHGSGAYVCANPDVVTGVNLGRRQEMATDLDDFPPMRWEPYFFRSEFFGMPISKRAGDMIRFTQAAPDPALFPFDRIKQIATNMLWYPREFFFDVGNPQGYQPLVEHLEKEMALAGVPMEQGENDIILTGGFQRALSLVLDFIVQPGQKVAIEAPSYGNMLNLLIAKHIDYVPIPMDGHGMDTEYLAGVLARGEVKAIITIPTFHNPTGICLSQERREHLLRLAMQHRVPIIEDDWGRLLRYEGEAVSPLKSLDRGGYVIHIGTFSKSFLPGLRIGWITCPAAISIPLFRAKHGADCGDSFFLQALLYDFIQKGHFDRHIRKSVKEYKSRRDAMCSALSSHLPKGCRFRIPQGGLSVWVELPEWMSSLGLLRLTREAGVDFLPASYMMPDRRDAPALRLAFSRNTISDITAGVKILCSVLGDCIEQPGLLGSEPTEYEDLFK
jgi:GntR family transcriptional regulator/MocR family aminotransferase